ncbi:hypothetical protein B0H10DRAFT_2101312, partial [Mycena sp. CBHHK59/15]
MLTTSQFRRFDLCCLLEGPGIPQRLIMTFDGPSRPICKYKYHPCSCDEKTHCKSYP